jgi:hypothetical protein
MEAVTSVGYYIFLIYFILSLKKAQQPWNRLDQPGSYTYWSHTFNVQCGHTTNYLYLETVCISPKIVNVKGKTERDLQQQADKIFKIITKYPRLHCFRLHYTMMMEVFCDPRPYIYMIIRDTPGGNEFCGHHLANVA